MVDLGRHQPSVTKVPAEHRRAVHRDRGRAGALIRRAPSCRRWQDTAFDRDRVRLILNRNQSSPQDFWVESIRKMFEINILSVIPNDVATLSGMPRDRFEFPSNSLPVRPRHDRPARLVSA